MICSFIFFSSFLLSTQSQSDSFENRSYTKTIKNVSSLCNLKVSIYIPMEFSMEGPMYSVLFKKKDKKNGTKRENMKTVLFWKHIFHCNLWYTMLVYKIGITRMVSCTYIVPPFKYLLFTYISALIILIIDLAVTKKSLFQVFNFFPESNLRTHNPFAPEDSYIHYCLQFKSLSKKIKNEIKQ